LTVAHGGWKQLNPIARAFGPSPDCQFWAVFRRKIGESQHDLLVASSATKDEPPGFKITNRGRWGRQSGVGQFRHIIP